MARRRGDLVRDDPRSASGRVSRAPLFGQHWDTRVLGSATLEFAFTAAGLLQLAHLWRPSLWDVAAGIVLIEAAGCEALTLEQGSWQPLRRFSPASAADIASWCQPVLLGERAALERALELAR